MSPIILTSLLIGICLFSPILAQEPNFQREIDTIPFYINGVQVHSLFAGGISYTKPAFADIDNDGDQDLFVGSESGSLYFFRNIGIQSFILVTADFFGTLILPPSAQHQRLLI